MELHEWKQVSQFALEECQRWKKNLIGVWVICIFLSCVQQKKILNPQLHFAFQQRGYNKQNGDVAILAAYHLVFDGVENLL